MEPSINNIVENCMICFDNTDTKILHRNCMCKIYSHKNCYRKWYSQNRVCMICRKQNINNYIIHSYNLSDSFRSFLFKTIVSIFIDIIQYFKLDQNKIIFIFLMLWILSVSLIITVCLSFPLYFFNLNVTYKEYIEDFNVVKIN